MLIVVLFLCLITSVFIAFRRKDALSFYLLGMSISNLVMLAGVIVYIAKMGGIAATQRSFLFLFPGLQRWLLYLPISMDKLGYMVAVGRTLFPIFVMLAALETSMIGFVRRRRHLFRVLAVVIQGSFLVYYFPPVFRALTGMKPMLVSGMMKVSLSCIAAYLICATALIVIEYRSTTIAFCRKNFGYVLLAVLSIEALYIIYATKDPAQIYNMYITEYIQMRIVTYIGPSLSALGWAAIIACTVFFVILGSYGLLYYTQIYYDESKQDLILQRKIDTAGVGISAFVHGIKNQLLANRVLAKKLSRALDASPPDMETVRAVADQMKTLTDGMLARMDELYQTVKSSALILHPVPVSNVVESSLERFHAKYPEMEIEVEGDNGRVVLADCSHLSEAIYNLLANGYEAAVQIGRTPDVRIVVHNERLWTVIEVKDNGGGITPKQKEKIFDPFYTNKNTNYNWGMGLYYVRKIVRCHFGTLRLESQEGIGSSFFVMLPLYDTRR